MSSSSSALLIKRSVSLLRHRRQNVIAKARTSTAAAATNSTTVTSPSTFDTTHHDNNTTPTPQSLANNTSSSTTARNTRMTSKIIKTITIPTIIIQHEQQRRRYASSLPSSTYYYDTDNHDNNITHKTPPVGLVGRKFDDNFPNPSHPLDEPTRFLINRLDDVLNEDYESDGGGGGGGERGALSTTRCNATLSSLLRWNGPGSAERANAILSRMERISQRTTPPPPSTTPDDATTSLDRPHPDATSYNIVTELYLRSGNVNEALSVYHRMIVPPDARSFFLSHLCRCFPQNLTRASGILDNMETYAAEEFERVMREYARWKTNNATTRSKGAMIGAELAEDLLNVMGEMVNVGLLEGGDVSRYTFNLVVDAWAKSHDAAGAQRAEQIISLMDDISSSSSSSSSETRYDISPDKYTFNSLLMAYITSKHAHCATHAERILKRMETSPHRYQKPDTLTYNTVMVAYGRAADGAAAAASQASSIPARILQLLQKVEHGYNRSNHHPHLRPDAILYGTALSLLTSPALLGYYEVATMEFVKRMRNHGVEPNRGIWCDLLAGVARRESDDDSRGEEEVLEILKELRKGVEEGRWEKGPSTKDYNMALRFLSQRRRDDAGESCHEILSTMENETHPHGSRPTLDSYKNVLKAWSRSPHPQRAIMARRTLRRLEMAGFTPDDNCFFSFFHACCHRGTTNPPPAEDDDASSLALALEIHSETIHKKNQIPLGPKYYRGLYDVCLNRMNRDDQRRIKLGVSLFNECCERGVVDEFILRRVKRVLPAKVLKRVLGDEREWSVDGLPGEWSRNVSGGGGNREKSGGGAAAGR